MMRLQSLDLEFFGHFTGKQIDFGDQVAGGSDFHVIYGPNEAGKTTLMEGYLRLLYGFGHGANEKYAFKHQRSNLKVSASLMIDGEVRHLTRLSTRNNNLLDGTGAPLPETAIQAPLRGLTIDDYRNLLCLDETSIVKGGKEIANSKGDVGRLLFSATAGVNDLSEVLETVLEDSRKLYLKGGSKHSFAELKRELDQIKNEIKDRDVTASDYQKRKDGFDEAKRQADALQQTYNEQFKEQKRIERLLEALPKTDRILRFEEELAPYEGYPQGLDMDPDRFVDLATERARLSQKLESLQTECQQKREAIAGFALQPECVDRLAGLQSFKDLRDRVGPQIVDLPGKRQEAADKRDEMIELLSSLGVKDLCDPDAFLLDVAQLQKLESQYQALQVARGQWQLAIKEESQAHNTFEEAKADHLRVGQNLPQMPDFSVLFERYDASSLVDRYQDACHGLEILERKKTDGLLSLTVGETSFETPPALMLNHADALGLVDALQKADVELKQARLQHRTLVSEHVQLAEQIRVRQTGDVVGDDDAIAVRQQRDQLWAQHRSDLKLETALAFEAAMHQDDKQTALRQAQSDEVATLRKMVADEMLINERLKHQEETIRLAENAYEELKARLSANQEALGLPVALAPSRFGDWVKTAEEARAAMLAHESEKVRFSGLFAQAEQLKKALCSAFQQLGQDVNTLPLPSIFAMARQKESERLSLLSMADRAKQTEAKALSDYERRSTETKEKATIFRETEEEWLALLDEHFGQYGRELPFPAAAKVLLTLRECDIQRQGFQRQISSMERDGKHFADLMSPFRAKEPCIADLSDLDAFDVLMDMGQKAEQDIELHRTLTETLEAIQGAMGEVQSAIDGIDSEVRTIGALFHSGVPVDTLEDLRKAVVGAKRGDELRLMLGEEVQSLCSGLGVPKREDAYSLLKDVERSDLEVALVERKQTLERLESQRSEAQQALGRAEAQLGAIGREADVAILRSRKQLIELEMEDTLLRHLRLRLGYMMADEAIRRYRDGHRSGMMEAAQSAFAKLTGGAYHGLRTQSDGKSEVLVALQASDEVAKLDSDMSKGTQTQLYLSLRAAAYEQMAQNGRILPFFCDDVFESFDETRTRAACQMMQAIGQTGQAIYLTHHRHVVDIAKEICGDDVRVHML